MIGNYDISPDMWRWLVTFVWQKNREIIIWWNQAKDEVSQSKFTVFDQSTWSKLRALGIDSVRRKEVMESDVFDVICLLSKNEQASEPLQKANNSFLDHSTKNLSSWHPEQIPFLRCKHLSGGKG